MVLVLVTGVRSLPSQVQDGGQALWGAWRAQQHADAFAFDDAIDAATDAIRVAERAQLPPGVQAWLYAARGNHILLLYEWDRALADYERAIALAPYWPEAYFRRGVLYYTLGPKDAALHDFARVLALNPAGPRAALAASYNAAIEREQAALQQAAPR